MYSTAAGGAGAPTRSYSQPQIMSGHVQRALSRLSARSGSPEHKSGRADIDMLPVDARGATRLTSVLSEIYFKSLAQAGDLEKLEELCAERTFLPSVLEEGAKIAEKRGHKEVQDYILSLWKFEESTLGGSSLKTGVEGRPSFLEPLHKNNAIR